MEDDDDDWRDPDVHWYPMGGRVFDPREPSRLGTIVDRYTAVGVPWYTVRWDDGKHNAVIQDDYIAPVTATPPSA